MGNLHKHAWREFRAAGWVDQDNKFNDELQEMICNHILKLLDVFADEGHSGTTAPYAINLFKQLAMYEPIVPVTGEDWEWMEVSDGDGGKMYQNTRCSHVFKSESRFDGQPYDLDGRVFWEWSSLSSVDDGKPFKSYFTSADSRVPITFPYTPQKVYVFVPNEKFPNEVL